MQQEWQRATEAWAIYSRELAQLSQRIDAQSWQRLLTALAECRGKSWSPASGLPVLRHAR